MVVKTPSKPDVAIIIPIMGRADDLGMSLPTLLNQNYPNYTVYVVDNRSEDALPAVLEQMAHPRLKLIGCPRPLYFSFSKTRNAGARYTFSDLLFFLNGDNQFQDQGHLSGIVNGFLKGTDIDYRWYRNWRRSQGYGPLGIYHQPVIETGYRRVYCHCLGSPLLIERQVFQQLGGFNEDLEDWGYEDTDLIARLELAGFGRIPILGIAQPDHSDDIRVKNFREKDKSKSWGRNRRLSDKFISGFGPIILTQTYPGRCERVEVNGTQYDGASAPQQAWEMELTDLTRASTLRSLLSAATKLLSCVKPRRA